MAPVGRQSTRWGRAVDRVLGWVSVDLDVEALDRRFSPIRPGLMLGSIPGPADIPELRAAGITHVVSCLAETRRPKVAFLSDDFEQLFLDLDDTIDQDMTGALDQFGRFIASVDTNGGVLVHCRAGVSRSSSLVVAHVMATEGRSFIDAYREVRAARIRALPNVGFASQLQRLEHILEPSRRDLEVSSLAQYLHEFCAVPGEIGPLEAALQASGFDGPTALRELFGGDIPRVVQGIRPA